MQNNDRKRLKVLLMDIIKAFKLQLYTLRSINVHSKKGFNVANKSFCTIKSFLNDNESMEFEIEINSAKAFFFL